MSRKKTGLFSKKRSDSWGHSRENARWWEWWAEKEVFRERMQMVHKHCRSLYGSIFYVLPTHLYSSAKAAKEPFSHKLRSIYICTVSPCPWRQHVFVHKSWKVWPEGLRPRPHSTFSCAAPFFLLRKKKASRQDIRMLVMKKEIQRHAHTFVTNFFVIK